MHSKTIRKLEFDMVDVIAAMEDRGLDVDLIELEHVIKDTQQKKDDIDLSLRETLGLKGPVNFNSSVDVSEILVSVLGVKPIRTSTGRFSTNRRILREINNPISEKIQRYRELEHLLSTLKSIHNFTNESTGKISCTYTDTCPSGRLYTKDYNLQGVPEVARDIFYADSDFSFILADYDSFELRILSALSHDTYFKDCWARGLDLHRKVVSDMKNILYETVTDKQRKLGKCLSFGQSYGQEPAGLARNLHISTPEAEKLMKSYKSNIPEIEKFKLETIKKVRKTGYTETFYGRRRYLPEILSPNIGARKKAERQAVNTAIQGCGADIIKFSLVKLHKAGFAINTMLHDSVLLTVPDVEISQATKKVRQIMETEINDMKFPVTIRTGKTWRECK